LEYGVDHPGEMHHLLSLVRPHMSVLTLWDKVHSLQFGNADAIIFEESQLLLQTKETVFLNIQEPATNSLQTKIACDVITYATRYDSSGQSMISYEPVTHLSSQNTFKASTTITIGNQTFPVTTNLF
jgi:UDP-N-acetylmuramyl pentapeptide synthase